MSISPKFPSEDELMMMSRKLLGGLLIQTPEEEALVQKVVDAKFSKAPISLVEVDYKDIKGSYIETPEQEAELQIELDSRREGAAISNGLYTKEEIIDSKISKMEALKEEVESAINEMTPEEEKVSTENFFSDAPAEEEKKEDIEETKQEEVVEEVKDDGIKCELCGSRGFRHKKDCPTLA